MSSGELAQWLGCSREKVYDLVKEGMPHYRLGIAERAEYRFSKEAVQNWLTQCCATNAVSIEELHSRRLPFDGIFGERELIRWG